MLSGRGAGTIGSSQFGFNDWSWVILSKVTSRKLTAELFQMRFIMLDSTLLTQCSSTTRLLESGRKTGFPLP